MFVWEAGDMMGGERQFLSVTLQMTFCTGGGGKKKTTARRRRARRPRTLAMRKLFPGMEEDLNQRFPQRELRYAIAKCGNPLRAGTARHDPGAL